LHVRLDHPEWEHVAALAGSTRHDELVDPDLSLEALVWRLFHEESEVRVEPFGAVSRGCRCTIEHYISVLGKFPEEDRAEMRNEAGKIVVDCAFCSKLFEIEVVATSPCDTRVPAPIIPLERDEGGRTGTSDQDHACCGSGLCRGPGPCGPRYGGRADACHARSA
ncbi:MAG: hypothetical protein GXC70_04485, partial [Sphingomonadaceae bacterium]|nr:hypothetical protein [Sphingomonadaceae bacterium]